MEQALRTSLIRAEAVQKHLSGPRMPRGIGDEKNATLQPVTGTLRASVQTEVQVGPQRASAKVFTNTVYARKHEFGDGVPKRPFLRPALEAKREDAVAGVIKALKKSITGED